jgi:hypothetical protein
MSGSEKVAAAAATAFTAVSMVAVLGLVLAFPIKWCWNETMPALFHLPEIGALQGWCLMFLGGTFFKANTTLRCKHDA